MIGVQARDEERPVVREFFELFKTPWEFWRSEGRYDVVLRADDACDQPVAKLVVVYGARRTAFDDEMKRSVAAREPGPTLSWNGERIPVYGPCVAFHGDDTSPRLVLEKTGDPVAWTTRANGTAFVRVGYDLFREIQFLLTKGQPVEHARIATLERHIGLLREAILDAGVPLLEIPPVPEGYRFMAVLTHDLDHPGIRFHRFDRTTLGFLYRAVVGSLVDACRGRIPAKALWRNWAAAFKLPLVHLGIAKDFWQQLDRYLEIEKGLGSTFFVIPVKGSPGRTGSGQAPSMRASSYGAPDVADQLKPLRAAGCEVGLHGIDAWCDSEAGSDERARIADVTGNSVAGVRMHWLFFDERAAQRLEQAGFTYDSTFGYNETVGVRAGTMQAFKPLAADRLLELPLTVMDTALFYPAHLNLTSEAARPAVWPLLDDAERHGGALVINWHDRSLAPERLWGDFYLSLVTELKRRGAWFPTASQAAAWFSQRRSATFDAVRWNSGSGSVRATAVRAPGVPGLTIRAHAPRALRAGRGARPKAFHSSTDVAFDHTRDTEFAFDAA